LEEIIAIYDDAIVPIGNAVFPDGNAIVPDDNAIDIFDSRVLDLDFSAPSVLSRIHEVLLRQ
jgi:hypothetical protein